MFGKKKSETITIAEVLRGTTPGRVQSVGYMQVIPVLSDLSDERFVCPVDPGVKTSTRAYGILVFDNPGAAVLIVPCHAAYVVKDAAQDHAMSHTGMVQAHGTRTFDTAACVQQTQGGLIRSGNYRMMILPFALRERALEVRHERRYGKLWDAISDFNSGMGIRGSSHLEYFLERFRKELDEFVAEFECVPGQVGAIILIDDQIVGVERAPSHGYWRAVWPALIRECYGSLAIQVAQTRTEAPPPPSSRVPLPEGMASLEDLGRAVEGLAAEEERRAKAIVREILDEPIRLEADETVEGLTLETVSPGRFVGQVIREDGRVLYGSILASKRWIQAERWMHAKPFTI